MQELMAVGCNNGGSRTNEDEDATVTHHWGFWPYMFRDFGTEGFWALSRVGRRRKKEKDW